MDKINQIRIKKPIYNRGRYYFTAGEVLKVLDDWRDDVTYDLKGYVVQHPGFDNPNIRLIVRKNQVEVVK